MAVRYKSKGDVFLDSNGKARANGLINFYVTATTTRKNTYTVDALTGGLENANPVVLDGSGRCTTDIFLSPADYKITLTNSDGTDSITDDPVHGAISVITGTTTNDSAAAGVVGEVISASQANSTSGLTTATPSTTASISLTAGDWDVSINALFNGGATTLLDRAIVSLSTVNNTLDNTVGRRSEICGFHLTAFLYSQPSVSVGPIRVSLTATTTYYFVSQADFSVSTCGTGGFIRARRVR